MSTDSPQPKPSAARIRNLFDRIAPRYDLLNRILSAGIDTSWRKASIRLLQQAPLPRPVRILDLCCGTGDFSLAATKLGNVYGCDFSWPMLERAVRKSERKGALAGPHFLAADALCLPFREATFSAVLCAFGVRNFTDVPHGLAEMHRVTRPGGVVGILELSRLENPLIAPAFRLWFHGIAPRLGRLVSGHGFAYRYLPESVQGFPNPSAFRDILTQAGFTDIIQKRFFHGAAVYHQGRRPGPAAEPLAGSAGGPGGRA